MRNFNARLDALYRKQMAAMLAYATVALGQRCDAEEAVQETFCVALTKPKALLSSPNPEGWLFTTLKFVVKSMRRDHMRDYRIFAEVEDAEGLPAPTGDARELVELVADVLGEDWELMRLVAIEGYPPKEAARLCGISYDACRKRIQRARARLRRAFDDDPELRETV